jgi:hypothetical protein
VTVMLPGFTVSVQSTHAPTPPLASAGAALARPPSRLPALSETVALCPEASVPAAGDTVTLPTRPDDSAIDQSTEPNEAVRVSVPPLRPSTIVVGVTVRTPRLGEELGVAVALRVAGADELGLELDGGAEDGGTEDGGAEVGGAEDGGDGCPV